MHMLEVTTSPTDMTPDEDRLFSLTDITLQPHETGKQVPVDYLKDGLMEDFGVFSATLTPSAGYEDIVHAINSSAIIILRIRDEGE